MTRRDALASLLVCATGVTATCFAGQQAVPYGQIFESVRTRAAAIMGRKAADVDTVASLLSQGMTERQFDELIRQLEMEFGIMISASEVEQAKWRDAALGLSVRRVAEMVQKRMRDPGPW